MPGENFLFFAVAVAILGILAMPFCRKPQTAVFASMTAAALASLGGALGAGLFLAGERLPVSTATFLFPFGVLILTPDHLSFLLILITALVWFPVSLFSFGYLQRYTGRRDLRIFGALFNLLFLGLVFTFLAGDVIGFLIAWEVTTAAAYLLVNFEYEKPPVARAGLIMVVMSEIGTLMLLAAFVLLVNSTGHFDFAGIRQMAAALPAGVKNAVFILALAGFGVKAGLVPLQVWLPLAHPAAPGNVSALLSGVILNMGIYGLARVVIDLPGAGPAWWGLVMVITGALTALLGILYALADQDLKRMLAYSSVENMGLIVLGLGAVLVYNGYGLFTLSALATLTALYHTLNHSVYKALLFLGAGAVDYAAGERNMDRLGGLIKTMPVTALFFLVGSLSIAALPPFNGFVSEWLTLQTLLMSRQLPGVLPKAVLIGGGVVLALTAALAITCFVKACGIVFLGQARSEKAQRAAEAPFSMHLGMGLLAVLCLFLGVLAPVVIPVIDRAVGVLAHQGVAGAVIPAVYTQPENFKTLVLLGGNFLRGILPAPGAVVVPANPDFSSIAPTYLIFALPAAMLFGALLARLLGGRTQVDRGPVWVGAMEKYTPRNQYSATAYSNPVLVLFGSIYRPEVNIVSRYFSLDKFRLATNYERRIRPFFELHLYRPLVGIILKAGRLLLWVQSGRINQYLAYMLLLLVGALVYLNCV
ncbi:MAG: proton-conducting transporter transmembrane domain-containing protein [Desulfotomaculales bacterium]